MEEQGEEEESREVWMQMLLPPLSPRLPLRTCGMWMRMLSTRGSTQETARVLLPLPLLLGLRSQEEARAHRCFSAGASRER